MLFHSVSGIPRLSGWFEATAWSRPLYIGGKKLILHGRGARTETETRLREQRPINGGGLRR